MLRRIRCAANSKKHVQYLALPNMMRIPEPPSTRDEDLEHENENENDSNGGTNIEPSTRASTGAGVGPMRPNTLDMNAVDEQRPHSSNSEGLSPPPETPHDALSTNMSEVDACQECGQVFRRCVGSMKAWTLTIDTGIGIMIGIWALTEIG